MDDKLPGWHTIDVPVIDGVATLPDGRAVRSSGQVVRIPVADNLPTAYSFDEPLPDSLDAAWAEAEAALPEGWAIDGLYRVITRTLAYEWEVFVHEAEWQGAEDSLAVRGSTPVAALRALAAKLRERAG